MQHEELVAFLYEHLATPLRTGRPVKALPMIAAYAPARALERGTGRSGSSGER